MFYCLFCFGKVGVGGATCGHFFPAGKKNQDMRNLVNRLWNKRMSLKDNKLKKKYSVNCERPLPVPVTAEHTPPAGGSAPSPPL